MGRSYLLVLLLLTISPILFAQHNLSDQARYGASINNAIFKDQILTSSNERLVLTTLNGYGRDVSDHYGGGDFWLLKLDTSNNIIWEKNFGGSEDEEADKIIELSDGNYLMYGRVKSSDFDVTISPYRTSPTSTLFEDLWAVKIDTSGNILWQNHYGGTTREMGAAVIEDTDGGLIFLASSNSSNYDRSTLGHRGGWDIWLFKVDLSGNIVWNNNFGGSDNDFAFDLKKTDDGYYILGQTLSTDGDVSNNHSTGSGGEDVWVVKLDTSRNIVWERCYGGTGMEFPFQLTQTLDGNFIFGGSATSIDGDLTSNRGSQDAWLVKIAPNGNIIWQQTYGGTNADQIRSILELPDTSILITGRTNSNDLEVPGNYGSYDMMLGRVNPNGNLQWMQNLGGSGIEYPGQAMLVDNQKVLISLSTNSSDNDLAVLPSSSNIDLWVFEMEMPYTSNTLWGHVYNDNNSNCVFEQTDKGIDEIPIKLTYPYQQYFSTTNNGSYSLRTADTGWFHWQLQLPQILQPLVQSVCDTQYSFYFNANNIDSSGFDMGLDIEPCALLTTSISSIRRRPCTQSNTFVEYCNQGFADAYNVEVFVAMPEFVGPVSASLPYTTDSIGRLMFQIDTLLSGTCGTIIITDSMACINSLAGSQSCTQSWITPANTCYNDLASPGVTWDGADLVVTNRCNLDSSVTFVIKNQGNDMLSAQRFRLYTAAGVLGSDSIIIDGGDSVVVHVSNNHDLVRLEVDNTPGNPYQSFVISEGGNCPTGIPSAANYTNLYSRSDKDIATDIECLTVVNSYDPNDKQVSPQGILPSAYVQQGELLEYKIRFQNTGTDTAYRVELVDTLSPLLDLTTLQIGVSSHAYQYFITGNNTPILHFVFDDIDLVDSTTNELFSQGFIKYKIAPYSNIQTNSVISNFADIYFDFNEPVRTDTPFVTIVEELPIDGSCTTISVTEHGIPYTLGRLNDLPNDRTVCIGSTHNVNLGTAELAYDTYTWLKVTNGSNSVVSNDPTLSFNNFAISDTGKYMCVANNSCGTDTSRLFTMNMGLSDTINLSTTICQSSSYLLGNELFYNTGTYYRTLISASGCDSNITLNLTVLPPVSSTVIDTICQGDTYAFGSMTYDTQGSYFDTLTNAVGCDSVVTLELTVLNNSAYSFADTICQGDTYVFGGMTYNAQGTYFDTLTNSVGCDSIVSLDLTVLNNSAYSFADTICQGDTYVFGGMTYNAQGTYFDTLTNAVGCDSVVTLELTVLNNSAYSFADTICQGDTYAFGSMTYDTQGNYFDTLTNAVGCDSIVSLDLTVLNNSTYSFADTICQGDTYAFGGMTYNTQGTYFDTLLNAVGCDSIVSLELVVSLLPEPTILNEGDSLYTQQFESYQWQYNSIDLANANNQYWIAENNGPYSVIVVDEAGCIGFSDSLNLTLTSVQHIKNDLNIHIYPNPSNGRSLTVQIFGKIQGKLDLQITDLSGKQAYHDELTIGSSLISPNLGSGMYFYTLSSYGKVIAIGKLMVL